MAEQSVFGDESIDPTVMVEQVVTTRATIVAAVHGDEGFRRDLEGADVLIVPAEGHSGYESPVFPQGTMEVLRFIRDQLPSDLKTDIAVQDQEYEELTLHAAILVLPTISVLGTLGGGLILNVLSNYIYDLLKGSSARRGARVRAKVLIHDENRTVAISYDGPAEQFAELTKRAFPESGATERGLDAMPVRSMETEKIPEPRPARRLPKPSKTGKTRGAANRRGKGDGS